MNSSLLDVYWVVGFLEGDGCFCVGKDGPQREVLSIVVRQADPQILFKLKKQFGFGSVFIAEDESWSWCVRGPGPLLTLMKLLNGRLFFQKRLHQFTKFVEAYNQKYGISLVCQTKTAKVNLDNAWLAGFADAEGSFSLRLFCRKDNGQDRLRIRFYVDQANALEDLKDLQKVLGGTLVRRKTSGLECHRLMVDTWKCAHGLVSYFSRFNPETRTLKVRWIRYCRVYGWYVNGEWSAKKEKIHHLITLNRRLRKKRPMPLTSSKCTSCPFLLKS